MAQRVQANLKAAGFNVELAGSPVGTWLQNYRDGQDGLRTLALGPGLSRSADYLAFMPGELVGSACRLAGGFRADAREAGRPGTRDDGRAKPRRRSTVRSSDG